MWIILIQCNKESIKQCTECNACIERCPYELPIHDMLRANYKLYEEHVTMNK